MTQDNLSSKQPYLVLARKYRPQDFSDLIGQESMVQTLHNAFKSGRIAQAFMLTGVRGVGKTTTARILARALNYQTDSVDAPTTEMDEMGVNCKDILVSQHIDVQEIDAASHTGIDNIREIIEAARYKPVSARYKVYIIDEVHMLSTAAFNGLLKTLEEPPEHVKFVFATTEIRKVPVTVLSRCQRFDLRRIPVEKLVAHFDKIATLEGYKLTDQALALVARAAEGSVRDGLSILDQILARTVEDASKPIEAEDVREMLGLADRNQITDLFERILAGDAAKAVAMLDTLYEEGAEPLQILVDMGEMVAQMTRFKATGTMEEIALSETERQKLTELAQKIGIPALSRFWQMLLQGLEEMKRSPDPLAGAMMIIVRLAHTADLPDPGDLIRALENVKQGRSESGQNKSSSSGQSQPVARAKETVNVESFTSLVKLCKDRNELMLAVTLQQKVRLVSFKPGQITLQLLDDAPRGLTNDLKSKLDQWTGKVWQVIIASQGGGQTLEEIASEKHDADMAEVMQHPLVKAVFDTFDDAQIADIKDLAKEKQSSPENLPKKQVNE